MPLNPHLRILCPKCAGTELSPSFQSPFIEKVLLMQDVFFYCASNQKLNKGNPSMSKSNWIYQISSRIANLGITSLNGKLMLKPNQIKCINTIKTINA
ncbi:hypothetical protein BpHYR1_034933 [Brachionus plicatilis]|uniref:Uncharacterized protein n=1 Tax=Brachionus plicatilis TaxID=10195 RepID=A0A3M7PAY2_BRAPC|nr:hypothetical protein BpHYR1_034933 [Brachionus plicatilis]